MTRLFLIAGEPSGDRLGGALMAGLKKLDPSIEFYGIGGPLMAAEGIKSIFPMSDLSVMGLAEVLPRLPKLLARIRKAVDAVAEIAPDALITIDSPDFCLRVAAKSKAANKNLKTMHYVAPTVWAWRPERAEKMAAYIDHVLALFPFEPPYMERAGMSCDFVGHPIVAEPVPDKRECARFRTELGIGEGEKMLLVLPGSRRGEIKRMLPVFEKTVEKLKAGDPAIRFVVPASGNVAKDLDQALKTWVGDPILLDPRALPAPKAEARKSLAFASADLALAASGTVSLELAAMGAPMVIAYKFNWLTTWIVKRKVKLKSATLVNILTDQQIIPEFLFADCTPERITPKLVEMLDDETIRTRQTIASKKAMRMLGKGEEDPGLRAARSVLAQLDAPSSGWGFR